MKSERRTFRIRSTKYSSSRGAAKAEWPLKMTRSKLESTATIKLLNLTTKRDSVFMAFSFGTGAGANPILEEKRRFFLSLFGCGYAALGYRASAQKARSARRLWADDWPGPLVPEAVCSFRRHIPFTSHNASKVSYLYRPSTGSYTTSRGGPKRLKSHSLSRALGLINCARVLSSDQPRGHVRMRVIVSRSSASAQITHCPRGVGSFRAWTHPTQIQRCSVFGGIFSF
jgi:hypothetical protein